MEGIKFIKSMYAEMKSPGLKEVVTEYIARSGNHCTKIESIDGAGTKMERIIVRGAADQPTKVIDNIFGKKETYIPAFPDRPQGVFLYSEDNVKTYFPNINFDDLCRY